MDVVVDMRELSSKFLQAVLKVHVHDYPGTTPHDDSQLPSSSLTSWSFPSVGEGDLPGPDVAGTKTDCTYVETGSSAMTAGDEIALDVDAICEDKSPTSSRACLDKETSLVLQLNQLRPVSREQRQVPLTETGTSLATTSSGQNDGQNSCSRQTSRVTSCSEQSGDSSYSQRAVRITCSNFGSGDDENSKQDERILVSDSGPILHAIDAVCPQQDSFPGDRETEAHAENEITNKHSEISNRNHFSPHVKRKLNQSQKENETVKSILNQLPLLPFASWRDQTEAALDFTPSHFAPPLMDYRSQRPCDPLHGQSSTPLLSNVQEESFETTSRVRPSTLLSSTTRQPMSGRGLPPLTVSCSTPDAVPGMPGLSLVDPTVVPRGQTTPPAQHDLRPESPLCVGCRQILPQSVPATSPCQPLTTTTPRPSRAARSATPALVRWKPPPPYPSRTGHVGMMIRPDHQAAASPRHQRSAPAMSVNQGCVLEYPLMTGPSDYCQNPPPPYYPQQYPRSMTPLQRHPAPPRYYCVVPHGSCEPELSQFSVMAVMPCAPGVTSPADLIMAMPESAEVPGQHMSSRSCSARTAPTSPCANSTTTAGPSSPLTPLHPSFIPLRPLSPLDPPLEASHHCAAEGGMKLPTRPSSTFPLSQLHRNGARIHSRPPPLMTPEGRLVAVQDSPLDG